MRTIKQLCVGLIASALALSAHALTLNSIALLNPAGSTSGQVIASTGPTTAPAWTTVTLSGLGGLAKASNLSDLVSVSTARTNLGLGTLSLQNANAIGVTGGAISGTPISGSTGAFTTIAASGLITPTSTIGIKATATNDNPQSGSVGEYPIATVLTNTSISIGVATNLCTLPLTPGDWDVTGNAYYTSGTTITQLLTSISSTSATNASAPLLTQQAMSLTSGQVFTQAPMTTRVSIASSANAYLVGFVNGTGSPTYQCILRARRPR